MKSRLKSNAFGGKSNAKAASKYNRPVMITQPVVSSITDHSANISLAMSSMRR